MNIKPLEEIENILNIVDNHPSVKDYLYITLQGLSDWVSTLDIIKQSEWEDQLTEPVLNFIQKHKNDKNNCLYEIWWEIFNCIFVIKESNFITSKNTNEISSQRVFILEINNLLSIIKK